MRPIKEIQQATHFKKVWKQDLFDKGLLSKEDVYDDSDSDDPEN